VLNVQFEWDNDQIKLFGSLIGNAGIFGILVGSISGGKFINGGRRRAIFIMSGLVFTGSGISLIKTIPTIIIGRFICGFTGGVFNMICSKSILESVNPKLNDILGTTTNLSICLSGIICALLGMSIPTDYEG
jgi:MFS family permease